MIDSFRKEHFFLSNFWPSGNDTLEHKFQAAKFLDVEHQKKVLSQLTPGLAKKEARRLTDFGLRRADWEEVRLEIMLNLLRKKFSQLATKRLLLETREHELIEGNTWNDRFWGCVKINEKWVGENHLGRLLMMVREELRDTYYGIPTRN